MKKILPILLLVFIALACDENENFVIFSVENDVELGQQVSQQIASDPAFSILPQGDYPAAYSYLNNMKDAILASPDVAYKDEFAWELYIIENDSVLNAFATPGGYIYIYTGLVKFLDNADDLAGVLGHEIAHSDQRHTVRNLQKIYGVQILLSILVGDEASTLETIAAQIAGTLAGLQFSREYEEEADAHSVEYLSQTQYACNGAARFFIKMSEGDNADPPEFLSTHPSPDNRIEDINAKADELGCDTGLAEDADYEAFKSSLP